ncbi:MAG TPA: hypothetical protein DDX98_04420 [Bacteroidales bacterium]|nr:hypothetical protein [Bacteroidales bacterium]
MKKIKFVVIAFILTGISCQNEAPFSDGQKLMVEKEIKDFILKVESSLETPSPEDYFNYFLQTDELAVATQGQLLTDPNALRDTINAHLSMMEKQSIEPVDEKIYVINNDAVVVSMSKVTTITFKNGAQFTMPYAWTMLIVRRVGEWKIAQVHN